MPAKPYCVKHPTFDGTGKLPVPTCWRCQRLLTWKWREQNASAKPPRDLVKGS